MTTTVELEGNTFVFDTTGGTTKFEGKTIPQPYRRRIDASLRMIAENTRFLK